MIHKNARKAQTCSLFHNFVFVVIQTKALKKISLVEKTKLLL